MVKIDNWSFVEVTWRGSRRDPYEYEFAPPTLGSTLHGKVTGHLRIEDGHRAHTTALVDIPALGALTTASGTQYELGKINPDYEEWMIDKGWAIRGYGWF